MRYEKPTFAGGEIGPPLYARIDTAKYQTALKRCRNFLVRRYGGVTRRPGFKLVGTIKGKTGTARLIPFQFSDEQSYVLEFTDLKMRVIKDESYVLDASPKTITGISVAAEGVVTSTSHGLANGAEIYIAGAGGMTQINGRSFYVSDAATNTFKLKDVNGAYINTSGYSAYTSGGTATAVYELTTPFAAADLFDLTYEQSADVMYFAHASYAPQKLSRLDHNDWTIGAVVFGQTIAAPTGVTVTPTGGGSGTTYTYVVTAVDDETGEESLASTPQTVNNDLVGGNKNTIAWSAVTNADYYRVYKTEGGVQGFMGSTDQLSIIDDGILQDGSDTPPQSKNPFSGADNYPSAVTFFEQRLCWGNTNTKPNGFFTSQSGNFHNMNVSRPAKANDAITAALVAREVNYIRHLLPLEDLLAFSSSAVFRISGGQNDFITPTSTIPRVQAYRGASKVRPIVVDAVVLYWQARGSTLRTLGYQFDTDGYRGTDLTIFAPHFFKNREIVDHAFAQNPLSTLWAVGDDGAFYVLTWQLEQDVWGWAKCETDGLVKSVASIPGVHGEDTVYAVIERTIGGVARRYVECLARDEWEDLDDAVYVDSAVAYSGSAATTFRGLEHLEGEEVDALADGAVVSGLTVSAGVVTLPHAAANVVIGLPYTSLIEPLPPGFATQQGSLQGIKKAHNRVTVRVERTRGLKYGLSEDDLFEYEDRSSESYDSAPDLKDGDLELTLPPEWSTTPTLVVVQDYPLPATINAVFPNMVVGG